MKRLSVVARLLPLAGIALFLALSSCRSPVQGSAGGSLSLSLSIPADLASDVPEPIRRAIGEAELAGSRPRFIHPDGKTVKAAVTKADGSEVGSATASLEAGASSATLTIADLPLNEALTLTVGVYDAGNSKVGERVVGVEPLSATANLREQTISIPPIENYILIENELVFDQYSEYNPLVPGKYYIVKLTVPSNGLFKITRNIEASEAPSFSLYDSNGAMHMGFCSDDTDAQFFGAFGQMLNKVSDYYLVFKGVEASFFMVRLEKLNQSMLISGYTRYEHIGDENNLTVFESENQVDPVNPIIFGFFEMEETSKLIPFTFYNAYDESITMRSDDIAVIEGGSFFSSTPVPSDPVPPGSIFKFQVLFINPQEQNQTRKWSKMTIIADSIENFIMSFVGNASGL